MNGIDCLSAVTAFVEKVKNLEIDLNKHRRDISDELLDEIYKFLRILGEQIGGLSKKQLGEAYREFKRSYKPLNTIIQSEILWTEEPSKKDRVIQTIATINNIVNKDAVPVEAKNHIGYHGDALVPALIALQEYSTLNEPPMPRKLAIIYAEDQLKRQSYPEFDAENTAFYLLRPSSSALGNAASSIVTLSYKIGFGEIFHKHLYFENQTWTTKEQEGYEPIQAHSLVRLISRFLKRQGAHGWTPTVKLEQLNVDSYIKDRYSNFN